MEADTVFVLQDDVLRVEVTRGAAQVTARVIAKSNGMVWGPAPLLALEVHDKTVRREERLERYRIDLVEEAFGALHVVVGDAFRHVQAGLWLRLVDGEISVSLPVTEVYERRDAHFRLFAVDILPGLLRVGADGRMLLPVGGGSLCSPAGKPALRDRFLIYLEQERWELATTLPFGAAAAAHGGMMILARQGAADAQCRVATDGQNGGEINFAFSLRRHWPDPVDFDTRELRFVPLAAAANLPMSCALRLRRHIMDDLGKPSLANRAAESPEVAHVLKSYTFKTFFARENEGLEGYRTNSGSALSFVLGMTFDECRANLARIHAAGIGNGYCQMVGWNARGHDGLYPARFPIEERLGGEERLRALIKFGNETLGYHMTAHDNFSMNIPHAPNFDRDALIHDVYGEPLLSGWWGGGLEYQSWGLALPHDRLEGHLLQMRGLGLSGMYYCDYMMRPLEVNYHPRWRGPRAHSARGQVRVLQAARQAFGAVATEYGILPAVVAADYVCSGGGPGGDHSWPVMAMIDRRVPMWDLAVQGLVLTEQTGLSWESAMRAVLFGKHIRDEWSVRPIVGHPPLDDARIARQKAMYDLCLTRFGHLQTTFITDYTEPAEKTCRTTFADGTSVSADFANRELRVNGQLVPCPATLHADA